MVGRAVALGCVVGVAEAGAVAWHATSAKPANASNKRFMGPRSWRWRFGHLPSYSL